MELGIYTFAELTGPAGGRPAEQRLRDLIEEIELADQVGLDVFGVGEHHRPDFAVSAPAVVLAAAAARTKRIRLTSAVTVLSSDDPGPRLPAVRDARPALRRPRRDHGRARLVHRVVPAVRLRPRRLRRAVRREARAAAAAARGRARHLVRAAPAAARRTARLPAPAAGTAAGLGRRRRQPAVGRARRRCSACRWRWRSSAASRSASRRSSSSTARRRARPATIPRRR